IRSLYPKLERKRFMCQIRCLNSILVRRGYMLLLSLKRSIEKWMLMMIVMLSAIQLKMFHQLMMNLLE
ncbi:hypothetical protein MKX01_026300, partial [Papaver californicum]